MAARIPWQRVRRAALLGCGVPALVFAGGALANPGMGSMSGGEDHHHATPKEKSGCSSCGGGSNSDPAARQQASGDAGKRARAAGDTSNVSISTGGGRASEDATGSIAQLGAAEQANEASAAKDPGMLDWFRGKIVKHVVPQEAADRKVGKGILDFGMDAVATPEEREAEARARLARTRAATTDMAIITVFTDELSGKADKDRAKEAEKAAKLDAMVKGSLPPYDPLKPPPGLYPTPNFDYSPPPDTPDAVAPSAGSATSPPEPDPPAPDPSPPADAAPTLPPATPPPPVPEPDKDKTIIDGYKSKHQQLQDALADP
jgi:hypothetical protein